MAMMLLQATATAQQLHLVELLAAGLCLQRLSCLQEIEDGHEKVATVDSVAVLIGMLQRHGLIWGRV